MLNELKIDELLGKVDSRYGLVVAGAKRDLKAGSLNIYDLLMDPSEELRGAKVEEMLLAVRGMGRVKVTRIMREAGVSRSKTLVGLTHGQWDRLREALGF